MLKIKLLSSLITTMFLISIVSFSQTNYYVSTTGDDANDGLSEGAAWRTISYAGSQDSPVLAGDHVYIKAGDYGNENVEVNKTGTALEPIIFEGYQSTPGDNPELNYTFGDALDATIMPLLDGGNRAQGEGIHLSGASYFHFKNIQITNYATGIYTWDAASTDLLLENIIVMSIGDPQADYSGLGIGIIYGSNNTVRNCTVVNSCAEGINIVADNITIDNCRVYCDEDFTVSASMDYYIVLAGNNNTIKDCYIERIGDLEHGGAGIGIKENGQNNLFENCTAKNLKNGGFYVRWAGVTNNEFRNCTALGTLEDVNGFLIRDGASNNEFNSCVSDGCSSAIRFAVNGEDQGYCGENNTFNNCIVRDAIWAIEYTSWAIPGIAENNTFANCVIDNATYLFDSSRENDNNKLVNCIVNNVVNLKDGNEPLNALYTYTNFYNVGFMTPTGTGNTTNNPLFVDASTGDYHLQEGSPCIDAGTAEGAPLFDFEGTARPQGLGIDMGIYEASTNNSIEELAQAKNLVFPNPATRTITLDQQYENMNYQLVSNQGKIVGQGVVTNNQIELNGLADGGYLIKFENTKPRLTPIKFILKN